MTARLNCWQVERCGREPRGSRVGELGICPAATAADSDGMNSGRNGGRICWTVAGTLCRGGVQGTRAQKEITCLSCGFFSRVKSEEAAGFRLFASFKERVT